MAINFDLQTLSKALILSTACFFAVEGVAAPAAKKTQKLQATQKARVPVKLPAKQTAAAPQVRKPFAPSADSSQWMRDAAGWTRTVRATDADAGTYYAETLGLVLDSQYVVVPWTFIADVWLSRSGTRLFIDGSRREATLADVDLVSNVALLKTGEPTVPTFYRTEIRLDAPVAEEPLLVLSARNWLRGGGRFLKTRNDGVFVRYQIAYGAGDMASVRYIFDKMGRLIAMSSGSPGGDDTWSAPSRAIYELIRKQAGPRPASLGDQRRGQLFYWQERWARAVVPTKGTLTLQNLECQTRPSTVSDRELAAQLKNMNRLDCAEKFALPVGGGYSAGIRVTTGDATTRSAGTDISSRLAQAAAAELFADFDRASTMVNLLTVPECRDSGVVNQQGIEVHVKFCTSGLKLEPGLADTAIVVSTHDGQSRASFAAARLKGFDQKNTKMVLESLVENVRLRK